MPQPIPGGYSAHVKPPQIENPGTLPVWESMYTAILEKLKTLIKEGKAQQAFKEIPLVMNMAQNYTENGQNVLVSDKSNFNSTLGQYVNAMHEDFDQYSSGKSSDPKYAADALYAKQQIKMLMTNPKYKMFSSQLTSVMDQLDIVAPPKYSTPGALAKYWASQWNLPDPSNTSTGGAFQGTSAVGNGFNSITNNLESQNTILNSQEQTYSKETSKDLAFEQDCYRSEMNMIKAPVTAAKSASN